MANFKEVLEKGELFDIGWMGDKFMWGNMHNDESFTKERLDRAMANLYWSELYRDRSLKVVMARSSNHRPILLSMANPKMGNKVGRKCFKYEATWTVKEECKLVIQKVWNKNIARGSQCQKCKKSYADVVGHHPCGAGIMRRVRKTN